MRDETPERTTYLSHLNTRPPGFPVRSGSIGPLTGVLAFFGGIVFIATTPAVWGYALVPLVLMIVVLLGLSSLGVWGAVQLSNVWVGEAVASSG